MIADFVFDGAQPFSEGMAAVKIQDKWGYIDQNGKLIIKPAFHSARPFQNGAARVEWEGDSGYIDISGKPIAEFSYLNRGGHEETRDRMKILANALYEYWKRTSKLPEEQNLLQELKDVGKEDVKILDYWSTPFHFQLSPTGESILIVSAGSDRQFQPSGWMRHGGSSDPVEDLIIEKNEDSVREVKYFADDRCDCEIFCLKIFATVGD